MPSASEGEHADAAAAAPEPGTLPPGDAAALEAAVEAALPEDAPPGHEAHALVKWDQGKWPLAHFTFGSGASKVRFQTTIGQAGTREAALRIARACFLRFEGGASVDEVKQYRQDCYQRIKEARGEGKKPPANEAKKSSKKKGDSADDVAKMEELFSLPIEDPEKLGLEDAPPHSRAHQSIRFDRCNDYYWFKTPEPRGTEAKGPETGDGQKTGKSAPKFAIRISRVGGDHSEAQRLARLCYCKFEAGSNKDEVSAYRDSLVAKLGKATVVGGGDAGNDKLDRPTAREPKGSKRKGEVVGTKEPKDPKLEGKNGAALQPHLVDAAPTKLDVLGLLPADPPEETLPRSRVRYKSGGSHGLGLYWFEYVKPSDGGKERFQTTVLAAGGSREGAERIARLCLAKFEAGASRAEVELFRNELYARCGEAPVSRRGEEVHMLGEGRPSKRQRTSSGKAKKGAAAAALAAALEKLRAEGRLDGALQVHGRDEKSKNASINGVYAVVKSGFEGKRAYEKADGSTGRFLFYSARKGRWKINESLNDSTGGFAYARVKDGGEASPGPSLRWQVFDGSSKGYNEDPAVRCELLEGAATPGRATGEKAKDDATESSGSCSESSGNDSEEEKDCSAASNSPASRSSGSSSSESGDDDGRKADESGGPPALSPPTGAPPAASPPAAVGALPPGKTPLPSGVVTSARGTPAGLPRRVCAKMLVRSRLRCVCHFAYISQCPGKVAA